MSSKVVSLYGDLLEQERTALLSADFASLESISRLKEAANEQILDLDASQWVHLVPAVERNQKLLNAAMRGLRSVTSRVSAEDQAFSTYSQDGKLRMPKGNRKFERKA